MPHDATPRNGRMREFRDPAWLLAAALAIVFAAAVAALAVATGLFIIVLPALAIVAAAYGLYHLVAARRRLSHRARFQARPPRAGVIDDGRALRRRSRMSGGAPP